LKVSDIDSKRMVIHIQGGKGRVEPRCDAQPKLLEELREQLAPLVEKVQRMAVSRQPLAQQ